MSGWNTIESDAGVFTELVDNLGVKDVEFEELLSIDQETLSAVNPLYGVVFLFKYRSSEFSAPSASGAPIDGTYYKQEDVFFAKQTIQNACATQAVLSILMNRPDIDIGDELKEFKSFVVSFDSDLKGDTISNSDTIRTVHNSFSRPQPFIDESSDKNQDENDDGLYHFIAYVPVNGTLYELDGLHPYPISHGPCETEQFAEKLAHVLQKRVNRAPEGELRFNLMALTNDKRPFYKEVGDTEALAQEEAKRAEWKRENALRRENFVGLIYQLVKGISSTKSDEEWKNLMTTGRANSQRRIEQLNAQRRKWKS